MKSALKTKHGKRPHDRNWLAMPPRKRQVWVRVPLGPLIMIVCHGEPPVSFQYQVQNLFYENRICYGLFFTWLFHCEVHWWEMDAQYQCRNHAYTNRSSVEDALISWNCYRSSIGRAAHL